MIPIRWPISWKDPAALDGARKAGLTVVDSSSAPPDVTIVKGLWPGIKMSHSGARDEAASGPTGTPWVDSNGWKIRITRALEPTKSVWIDAKPPEEPMPSEGYVLTIADAAASGGRWIISLDEALANGIAARDPKSLGIWNKITGTAAFFEKRTIPSDYTPVAVVGILSDFSGKNQVRAEEIVNLISRANQQYRVISKQTVSADSFADLRALIYPNAAAPEPDLRRQVLSFVHAGGLLITTLKWGEVAGVSASAGEHPRYALRKLGEGRIAVAQNLNDPYMVANDSAVLISHRYDVVRFWNAGAVGSSYSISPDQQRAALEMVFYAMRGVNDATVSVAGPWRSARLRTIDQPESHSVRSERRKSALEIYLPPVDQYAALELE